MYQNKYYILSEYIIFEELYIYYIIEMYNFYCNIMFNFFWSEDQNKYTINGHRNTKTHIYIKKTFVFCFFLFVFEHATPSKLRLTLISYLVYIFDIFLYVVAH